MSLADVARASVPSAATWLRFVMRLSMAGAVWMSGFVHVAQILAVLAAMVVIGTIEAQFAKALVAWRTKR